MADAVLRIAKETTGSFGPVSTELRNLDGISNQTAAALGGLAAASGVLSVALVALANDSARAFGELQTARQNIQALGADTTGIVEEFRTLANDLDNNTTAAELLAESYDVVSAGFAETNEQVQILEASFKAAEGNLGSLGDTTGATLTVLKAWGLEADQAATVADKFTVTIRNGRVTLGELAPELQSVAASAAAAGVSIDEVLASVATGTADGGQQVNVVVTGLKRTIDGIIAPTEELKAVFDELGTTGEQLLQERGLAGALAVIEQQAGGSSTALAEFFSGARARDFLNSVLPNLESFERNLGSITDAAGETEDAYAAATNSYQSATSALANSVEDLKASLGAGVAALLTPLVNAAKGLVNVIKDLPQPVLATAGALIAVTGAAAGLTAAVIGLVAAKGLLVTALGAVSLGAKTALGALLPFAPAIVAIGVATAAVIGSMALLTRRYRELAREGQAAADQSVQQTDLLNKLRDGAVLTEQEIANLKATFEDSAAFERVSGRIDDLNESNREAAAAAEAATQAAEEQAQELEDLALSAQIAVSDLEDLKTSLQFDNSQIDLGIDRLGGELQVLRAQTEAFVSELEVQQARASTQNERDRIGAQIREARVTQAQRELEIELQISRLEIQRQANQSRLERVDTDIQLTQNRQAQNEAIAAGETGEAALLGAEERLLIQRREILDEQIADTQNQLRIQEQIFQLESETLRNRAEAEEAREQNLIRERQERERQEQFENSNRVVSETNRIINQPETVFASTADAAAGAAELERQLEASGRAVGREIAVELSNTQTETATQIGQAISQPITAQTATLSSIQSLLNTLLNANTSAINTGVSTLDSGISDVVNAVTGLSNSLPVGTNI